jgi:DNA processing protein
MCSYDQPPATRVRSGRASVRTPPCGGSRATVSVDRDTRERAAVLALAVQSRAPWHFVSQAIEEAGSALHVAAGGLVSPDIPADALSLVAEDKLDEFVAVIERADEDGFGLVTVLDEDYPTNLRLVVDRPPFLFTRGDFRHDDDRAVAVVGTRRASPEGLEVAGTLARELAHRGVTVVSGLALGIDGAAHTAALEADGRTVAVVGTGIRRVYPPQHEALADRICETGGAIISQFLPDSPPRREHFPLRNRTMSGYAVGTIVVEASSTSGARMQARLALEHGKRVLLWRDLVTSEKWTQNALDRGATVVDSVDDVVAVLDVELRPAERLAVG